MLAKGADDAAAVARNAAGSEPSLGLVLAKVLMMLGTMLVMPRVLLAKGGDDA